MGQHRATRNIVVSNHQGLHARAATLVAELVRRYDAEVRLIKNNERALGTEVLQILSLGVGQGERLTAEATGHDAEEVLDALEKLFAANFCEDAPETTPAEGSQQTTE